MSDIIRQNYDDYIYLEIPKEIPLDAEQIKKLQAIAGEAKGQSKKIVFSPPTNFKIATKDQSSFLNALKKDLGDKILFVPQEGLQWSKSWNKFFELGFPLVEKHKGILWATGKGMHRQIQTLELGKTLYLQCSGNMNIKDFSVELDKALERLPESCKIQTVPVSISLGNVSVWSYLEGALIIDIANVFVLNKGFFQALTQSLQKKNLTPDSENIYFFTSGLFQSWLLKQGLETKSLHEISNIIHVMPDTDKQYNEIVASEVRALAKLSTKQSPPMVFLSYQVKGKEQSIRTIESFYPDIIITEEISDANYLKQHLPEDLAKRLYSITPSNDPGLLILSPEMISQGYDLSLYSEYLISRYRNNRGFPNDTYIYYMNAQAAYLKKVTAFFIMEFDYLLEQKQKDILGSLAECEPKGEKQGSFTISLLQDKILKLDMELPLSMQGASTLLSRYPQLFAHHYNELCSPLRLFLRSDPSLDMIQSSLHLVHDYNELSLKQEGFWLEARLQENHSVLTIKSNADKSLEKRCFSFFAILNGSDVFHRLPDKEIFISLISTLWENYQNDFKHQSQGFLITLTASAESSEMKVFQSEINRLVFREEGKDEQTKVQMMATFPYHKGSQRALLKLISHLFTKNPQDFKENAWRFACFEAVPQIVANCTMEQNISLDLSIDGDRWCCIFSSSSKEKNTIADRSRKMFDSGAGKVHIAENGRSITLIRNPKPDDMEIVADKEEESLHQELESLQENTILQDLEDQKSKEAEERSLRLQKIYDKALSTYNKKYGFEENELEPSETQKPSAKTLEQALKIKIMQRKQPDLSHIKKRRNIMLGVGAFFFVLLVGFLSYAFLGEIKPTNEGLFLVDTESPLFVPPASSGPQIAIALPPGPAKDLVEEICQTINLGRTLDHDQINAMIKKLYFCEESFKACPDIYNLMGRLFWYKIHLDQYEKYFSSVLREQWKKESLLAFELALQKYRQNQFHSNFRIAISGWQAERRIYPENQNQISYSTNQEAMQDVEKIIEQIKKITIQ
ncbi:MAG: hypothetical protein HUU50_09200 [Candidatus Brocadiae bacterium]|nr:hypothetical protein [Candidatus Brocadiia bacterium]